MKRNTSSTRKFREKLLAQKAQLERSVLSAAEAGRLINAEDIIDPADQAVLSYQRELMFSHGTNERTQLSLIQMALVRLDEGTYGECLMCGEEISPKRLEAVPWTPYCISCQEKVESGEVEAETERAA